MLERVKEIVFRVRETAAKADLLYVVCIWKGPFSEINYRVGYFESNTEATFFGQKLKECYTNKFQLPFIIYSSVDHLNNVGNLFD